METKARVADITKDYKSGKIRVAFVLESFSPEEFEGFQDKDLRLRVCRWRNKRSLDANAYLWVLCAKIAEVMQSTKEEIYEIFLHDYPCYDTLADGSHITITMLSEIDVGNLDGHYQKLKTSKDGRFTSYIKLKGSSEMDTKEMSVLLDAVIAEAKNLGIETATPDELERMCKTWRNQS